MGTESELLADTWGASSIRPVFLSGLLPNAGLLLGRRLKT